MSLLNLDAWWDEPAYKAASGNFSERGAFILAELKEHDAAKLADVLADLYRVHDVPGGAEKTRGRTNGLPRGHGCLPLGQSTE